MLRLIRVRILPILPLIQCLLDTADAALPFTHTEELVLGRMEEGSVVFATANIGAEAIMVENSHTRCGNMVRREGDAAQDRINCHICPTGMILPIAQVGGDNPCRIYWLPDDVCLLPITMLLLLGTSRLLLTSCLLGGARLTRTSALRWLSGGGLLRDFQRLDDTSPDIQAFVHAIVIVQTIFEDASADGRGKIQFVCRPLRICFWRWFGVELGIV